MALEHVDFTIWIDADGCPVVPQTISIASQLKIPVTVVKNIHHSIHSPYATVITVDTARDSADFYIVNHLHKGDLVITQDHGMAAMVLARGGLCINQNGTSIDHQNIDQLLERRHINQESRRKHGKYPSSKFKKRTSEDDQKFETALISLLENLMKST